MSAKEERLAQKEADLLIRGKQVAEREAMVERTEQSFTDLHVLRRKNIDAARESDREYAEGMLKGGIELAKLEAEIEAKKSLVAELSQLQELKTRVISAEALVVAKDTVIACLTSELETSRDFSKFLAGLLPKVELDKLNLNLNADIKASVKAEKV